MSLIKIENGTLADPEVVNDNFEYLDDKITATNQSIATVQSNLQSLGTTLNNKINQTVSNLPSANYIDGLIISKSSNNTIAITSGSCYDSTKTLILTLSTDTTKTNSSQAQNTTYYVYIIGNTTSVDILITTSSSTPALPSGYTYYRQIGNYLTNSDNEIYSVSYFGIAASDNSVYGKFISGCPDWSAKISKPAGVTYTVDQAGWVYMSPSTGQAETRYGYINDIEVCRSYLNAPYSSAVSTALCQVSVGDTYRLTAGTIYFIPIKGGN